MVTHAGRPILSYIDTHRDANEGTELGAYHAFSPEILAEASDVGHGINLSKTKKPEAMR